MIDTERAAANEDAARMARKRLVGMILMAAGGMLALLCGLCTLAIGVAFIFSPTGTVGDILVSLLFPLIVGGVPAAIGATVFVIGLGMHREGRARRDHPERVFD